MEQIIDKEIIEKTVAVLRSGGVILYPTDTVWGIGCDATNRDAVKRIFEIKERADHKAMIVLTHSVDEVARYVNDLPHIASELLRSNGDGGKPLTLILPQGAGVASNLLPPEETIAIRVPQHKFCKLILRKLHRPVVSTSANISGEPTPSSFDKISKDIISKVDYVVPRECEGQPTGKPSSIISISEDGQVSIIRT